MMMSDLPKDLVEEILSRVPFKDLRAVRSTCKQWNDLSKTQRFVNKHIDKAAVSGEKEFLMTTEFSVYIIGVNLHTSQNKNVDLSIERKARLICRGKTDVSFFKSQVIHCNGVFLCVWSNILVVWNPYWGKRNIPRPLFSGLDMPDTYALGYDKSCCSLKILRLLGSNGKYLNYNIYDLSSNSWTIPDDTTIEGTIERDIDYMQPGVSCKGDTYWYAIDQESKDCYLFCFDFTNERFGPRLPLPFNDPYMPSNEGYATLSAVKEEKLAVLLQQWDTMDVWVTNKIEPDAVSWSIFVKVDMKPSLDGGSFFIDEEKKVAVFFVKERPEWLNIIHSRAYIIGENGYFRNVDLRESPNEPLGDRQVWSYVPSSMKII